MDLQCFLCWRVAPLLLLMPCGIQSMSVRILNEEPVYVIPSSSLVLKARIEQGPLEEVSVVTWERESETGLAPGRVTLAMCPSRSVKCAGARPNVHVNVEQQETTLEINGYSSADSGVYAVTVTDHTGANITAHCIVRLYEAVHHVSVSINVSHSSLVCGEAWGTEPQFSWLYERVAITKAVGRVSKDGTTLFVNMTPLCGHFTCMVSNKLGYSSATYSARDTGTVTEERGCTNIWMTPSEDALLLHRGLRVENRKWAGLQGRNLVSFCPRIHVPHQMTEEMEVQERHIHHVVLNLRAAQPPLKLTRDGCTKRSVW
ncbi:hypothetical protein L3Q82_002438 [Scortum barcoo]|uniref:Uncharacterized protein n=1 Tax=Scortum barcoo TaxID=214431 RepID=A0ACB8VZC8_9TELE|nr:hypothetical protein L3Q82_002438 [Scortum barcoo]